MIAGDLQNRRNQTLGTILSAWDENLLAKHYPGQFKSRFVAGMDQISSNTGLLHANTSLTQAGLLVPSGTEGALTDIGSKLYTVVVNCPSLTCIYGTAMSARLGGLIVGVTDVTTAINFIKLEDFADADNAYSMIDIYQSDGSNVY